MREASSLVRPMSNLTISYCARYSMILSKIADRWPESIRCPSASIVSLAAMGAHSSGTVTAQGEQGAGRHPGSGILDQPRDESKEFAMSRPVVVKLGIPALVVAALAVIAL